MYEPGDREEFKMVNVNERVKLEESRVNVERGLINYKDIILGNWGKRTA